MDAWLDQKGPRSLNYLNSKKEFIKIQRENELIKQKIERVNTRSSPYGPNSNVMMQHMQRFKQSQKILAKKRNTNNGSPIRSNLSSLRNVGMTIGYNDVEHNEEKPNPRTKLEPIVQN